MTTHTNREKAQAKQQAALEKLEQGILNIATEADWRKYLDFHSKFYNYSAKNSMLIYGQYPDASHVAGYRAWQKHGRQVRKGEKGIVILAPCKKKVEDEKTGDKAWQIFGFKTASVFDVSQTDGEELQETDVKAQTTEAELYRNLKAFGEAQGFTVLEQAYPGAYGVCIYKPSGIEIQVDPLLSVELRASILAHELGHALMHNAAEYCDHTPTSTKELEAESVAYCVTQYFGVAEDQKRSFAYINCWNRESDQALEQFKASMSVIAKTVKAIIEGVESTTSTESKALAIT
ncbi:ImmA/IrrE family metallo-endopeptidase (plasmid) [Acaryochloris sp. 'Moss Beach']|uniref:ArdC-like ssDNA-binding domain-containing protein n=1 Tax=Acaryochloris sp. 'Moss Beach' TaxID=2740837 RepID=UPI001EECD98C|nr:ArdC-like ssDNA-binding domain-containing protein [Acaryochloris sp. 'Moss Beach']UJB72906.1 ImmA/IrrE family metallo-endopeptidase [Acaryochloris sp. 'Moss Beach']